MSRIEDLERRLGKDPNSKIFAQLAEEYRKAGRLEEAIQTCRDGLETHPNYFSARVALGRALLETGSLDESRQEFEAVLAQVPDNILANKFLGKTYEQLGRLEDAVAKYRIAQMLAPEDSNVAERVQSIEAQLDGVSRGVEPGPQVYVPPPPPTMPDPTGIELPELPELDGAEPPVLQAPAVVVDESPAAPSPLLPEPPGLQSTEGQSYEAPLVEQEATSGYVSGGEQVFEFDDSLSEDTDSASAVVEHSEVEAPPEVKPDPEQVFEFDDSLRDDAQVLSTLVEGSDEEVSAPVEAEGEQVFEFDDSPAEQSHPASVSGAQQESEMSDSPPIPEQAYVIQDDLERGFGEGKAGESADKTPSASGPEPESFVMPEPPVMVTPPALPLERGVTEPLNVAGETPFESAPPDVPTQEMPAETDGPLPQAGMSTATLAELYASQGHIEEALGVYRELAASNPDDIKFRQRVEELSMLTNAQTEDESHPAPEERSHLGTEGSALRETIRLLEGWLAAMRKP